MNHQDMFTCGAVMALAVSGCVTTADATPVDPPSGITVSHVVAHEGSPLLAEGKDAKNHAPPQQPTAKCADGTFSYNKHRPAQCSHHGRVVKVPIDDPSWDSRGTSRVEYLTKG